MQIELWFAMNKEVAGLFVLHRQKIIAKAVLEDTIFLVYS